VDWHFNAIQQKQAFLAGFFSPELALKGNQIHLGIRLTNHGNPSLSERSRGGSKFYIMNPCQVGLNSTQEGLHGIDED
jgi:hypothetical protein